MFLSFTKKGVIITAIFAVLMLGFGFILSSLARESVVASPYELTIVIDAGHGGIDGGSVGKNTGITESELNLIYANKLEKLLKSVGVKVVKTRNSMEGLYEKGSESFKKQDMQKRKEIIQNASPQAVVSIHMNKFSLKTEKGAQVFYQKDSESGKNFADAVRDELVNKIDNARSLTLAGDYFMCKCADVPSIIVECGFLSDEAEEKLLQSPEYQDKLCYAIFCGIMKYFNLNTQN